MRALLVVSALVFSTAHAQITRLGGANEAITAAIDSVWAASIHAVRQGDAERAAAAYARDAVFSNFGFVAVSGRDSIDDAWHQLFATHTVLEWTMRRTALVILGDLAVDDGTFAQVTREKDGSTQKRAGHYSAIFRRENGRWLLWRDDATSDAIEEM